MNKALQKGIVVILPIIFTAQACNFLFGDLYGNQGSGPRGTFVSTDSGDTWAESNQINKSTNMGSAIIAKLALEPGNSSNVLAAAVNAGVYASDNKGKTWGLLLPNFAAYDVAFNPTKTQEIFAAGARGDLATILKSSDHGTTWVQTYSYPAGKTAVTALVFDPVSRETIYAAISTGTLLKSTNSGKTWIAVKEFEERLSDIAISSDAAKTIYVLVRAKGLSKSTDSGRTWIAVNVASPGPSQYNRLVIDPTNASSLYIGTNQGLFRSRDSGFVWTKLSLPVNTNADDVTAVAVNPEDNRQIFAGILSTFYRSSDSGTSWHTVSLSTRRTILNILIDRLELNRIYAGLK